jgi:hypothetical protein
LLPGSLIPHREEQRLEAQLRTLMAGYRGDRKVSQRLSCGLLRQLSMRQHSAVFF